MGEDLIIMLAAGAGITCTIIALANIFGKKSTRASERLREFHDPSVRRGGMSDDKGAVGNLMDKAAPKLSKALESQSELEKSALKVRLANAGFSQPTASQVFLTIKLIMMVVFAIAGISYGLFAYGASRGSLASIIIGAGFCLLYTSPSPRD